MRNPAGEVGNPDVVAASPSDVPDVWRLRHPAGEVGNPDVVARAGLFRLYVVIFRTFFGPGTFR